MVVEVGASGSQSIGWGPVVSCVVGAVKGWSNPQEDNSGSEGGCGVDGKTDKDVGDD